MTPTRELGTDAQPRGTKPIHQLKNYEDEQMRADTTITPSTDLVPAEAVAPTPYYGGSEAIRTEDLALPRLYTAQPTSAAVQEELVPSGALFAAYDATDPDPKVLYRPGQKTGLVAHVLGKRSVWCYRSEEDDRFMVVDREGPALPAADAMAGYEFAVLVPSYDQRLPCAWLLKSSSMATGKRMLTAIARAEVTPWSLAFSLTTIQRVNDKGKWFVPTAAPTKAKAEHVAAAAQAAMLLGVPGENA